jgi:hypothetical protein
MRITTDELRRATLAVLAHLERTGRGTIELDADYYWSIAPEQRYDVYTRPDDLSIGRLSDDWAEVAAIARGDEDAVGYALVWLASVLRAVGERTVG